MEVPPRFLLISMLLNTERHLRGGPARASPGEGGRCGPGFPPIWPFRVFLLVSWGLYPQKQTEPQVAHERPPSGLCVSPSDAVQLCRTPSEPRCHQVLTPREPALEEAGCGDGWTLATTAEAQERWAHVRSPLKRPPEPQNCTPNPLIMLSQCGWGHERGNGPAEHAV